MGRKLEKKPTCDYSDPTSVLRAFMAAMNEWERRARVACDAYKGRYLPSNALNSFWRELGIIFDKYCAPRTGDRRGRLQYRSVGMIPTYDTATEDIVEVLARPRRRVEISTRRGDPKAFPREFIYVLEQDGDRWLLKRKKWLDNKGKANQDCL
jgi:hypothetical protein